MARMRVVGIGIVTLMGVLLLVPGAWAQQAGGVAGVVRDTSGGVLPGVTVVAASPALIEKERTAITDGDGRYTIVDLRPGSYTITFTLPGFATVKREGIELTTGFTATVNADLRVGAVEETITVSGAAPVVDTQTVRQQKLLSQDVLAALPSGNVSVATLVTVTAGFGGGTTQADVGGTRDTWGAQGGYTFYHGKTGTRANFDGMRNQHFSGTGSGSGAVVNSDTVAEFQLETTGMSAEAGSGTTIVNAVPKEGSNIFAVMLNGKISTTGMQSDNLSDALRARGLTTSQEVQKIYRAAGTVGGPIMRDRMWFFGAVGRWGQRVTRGGEFFNKLQGTLFHEFDLNRPAENFDWYRTHAGRVTWQVTPRNKVNVFGDIHKDCRCTTAFEGSNAIEAQVGWDNWPSGMVQGTWSAPLTNKLLLEAGFSWRTYTWINIRQPGVTRDHISILEQSTGYRYGSPTTMQRPQAHTGGSTEKFSLSYVTGTHNFKVGVTDDQGFNETSRERNGPDGVQYTFLRGVPVALDMYAIPFHHKERMKAEVGIFAQDQWKINRLTMNVGLRYDYVTAYSAAEDLPAGPFVPARHVDAVYKIPEWKDWNPRMGASYDLFGNGRTALKASLGRFNELPGSNPTEQIHPLAASVLSAARSWTDADGDYVPDCDLKNFAKNGECGVIDDQNFGYFNPKATRFSDDMVRRNRRAIYDFTTEVQHELFPGLSVSAAYNHNWDRNFRVTDNLLVTPADYSPYCITAPLDARLPGGGGYPVCGLYDVNPNLFGQVTNLVTIDSNFGKQTRVWDGVSLSVNGRFGRSLRVGGGVDTGRQVVDNCFVVDYPGASNLTSANLLTTPQVETTIDGQRVCRNVTPPRGLTQLKVNASYQLPGDFLVGALFQQEQGPQITADYPASNAEIAPSLGRSLAGGRRSATVPLMLSKSQFEKRFTQLDLRMSKIFRMGKYRLQGNVDLYNALNSNSILSLITTYGSRWKKPLTILDARLLQLSGQVSF